jgi:hypothetical protein
MMQIDNYDMKMNDENSQNPYHYNRHQQSAANQQQRVEGQDVSRLLGKTHFHFINNFERIFVPIESIVERVYWELHQI